MCTPDGTSDIYIKGVRNRNRALHGDTVILEILPESEWIVQHEAVQDYLEMHGTEADHRILLQGAVFNIKQEKEAEPTGATTSTAAVSSLTIAVEVDTYHRPGPRGPDNVVLLSSPPPLSLPHAAVNAVGHAAAASGVQDSQPPAGPPDSGWGPGHVGSGASWDTAGVQPDLAANRILTAVMMQQQQDGLSTELSVEEVAVDLPPGQRVPVERSGPLPVPPTDLVIPLLADSAVLSSALVLESQDVSCDSLSASLVVEEEEETERESDQESEESQVEDLEQRIEDEAFRLANLGLDPEEKLSKTGGNGEVEPKLSEENDDGPDVVVETVADDYGQPTGISEVTGPARRTRRGRRGAKRGGKKECVEQVTPKTAAVGVHPGVASIPTVAGSPAITASPAVPGASSSRRPPKVALIEYAVDAVLSHTEAARYVQRTARVVNIIEFKHSKVASGTLKLMTDKNPNFALFSPSDSRVPRMKIPISECPPNFLQRSQDYSSTIFVAKLVGWDQVNSALGQMIRSLGDSADIEVRTEGLLMEHSIDYAEFSDDVLADLPADHAAWSIPEAEIARRRDFRSECVFTIDPLTARDLDDALSVTQLDDGLYRIGVHIADVSYFIPEGSALDRAAADRATSAYLVQKVIPMLPRPLCENLCSLNPGEDRLCYTVEWTMSPEGDIVSEWFGRTVIRSCVKLAYEHAQSMIDKPAKVDWVEGEIPRIECPYTPAVISKKVNLLQQLAVKLREKRERQGYLRLDQAKLSFTLDPSTGMPDGFRLQERWQSNKLIEEFMLLANMAVAKRIHSAFPTLALLRRHPPPKKAMMSQTLAQMKTLGVDINGESAGALGASIAKLGTNLDQALICAVVTCLFSKPMELAQYFCSGMFNEPDYHHFALNVPFYTHFTSPIRRYPDIMVHRLLEYAVNDKTPDWKILDVQCQALQCNDKKLLAKRAGEASAELFLSLFVAESGPLNQVGCVVNVLDHAVDVLLVELGLVKRAYLDRLDITSFSVRRLNAINYLHLVWKSGRQQTLTIFTRVDITLRKGDKPFDFLAVIEEPVDPTDDTVVTID